MSLDLGPCRAYFGTAPDEVDLGLTQGGVRLSFSQDVADLLSDQYGTQPEDQVITGHAARIIVPMADYDVNNIATALHQTRKQIGAKEGIKGSTLVGTKMTTYGHSLLLKKYVNGAISSNENDWIRFPNAVPGGNFEVTYDGSTQRIIESEFVGFPDANGVLYFIGDEDAAESGS